MDNELPFECNLKKKEKLAQYDKIECIFCRQKPDEMVYLIHYAKNSKMLLS